MKPVFITGIGTDAGKTLVSAIVATALEADYWKPVQAGYSDGTDAQTVERLLTQPAGRIHPEVYKLKLPASPHIAAAREGLRIDLDRIASLLPQTRSPLVIEGAGGLCVPLNEKEFIYDLITRLDARVILVSKNYLGSINHSLLTAAVCRLRSLRVMGWIFNGDYMDYQQEIAGWSGYPIIGKIPHLTDVTPESVGIQAARIKQTLLSMAEENNV